MISVKALSLLIFVLLSSVVDMSYPALHASPTPSTELEKLNEWMDGMDGIGASDGLCEPGYVKCILPFHSESTGRRCVNRKMC